LTGTVPIADEEFATLEEGSRATAVASTTTKPAPPTARKRFSSLPNKDPWFDTAI
jgi:hypothetical protein